MNNIQFKIFFISCLLLLCLCRSEYKVTNAEKTSSTITLSLAYTGADDYFKKPTSPILKELTFTLHVLAFQDFTFKITDPKNSRFEIPQEGSFPIDPLRNFSFPLNLSAIRFEYTEQPFDFKITRKINNATLFSTYETNFIFSDKYIEIGTELDSD